MVNPLRQCQLLEYHCISSGKCCMRSATKVVIFIPFQWVTFESYFRFFLAEQHARSNMVKMHSFFFYYYYFGALHEMI